MGILSRVSQFLGVGSTEARAGSYDNGAFMLDHGIVGSGVSTTTVGPNGSLKISTVYAAQKVIAESFAGLPTKVYSKRNGRIDTLPDHDQAKLMKRAPSKLYTSFTYKRTMCIHLFGYGNAYAKIIRNENLRPIEYEVCDPKQTMPFIVCYPDGTRDVWYKRWDTDEIIMSDDMIHWVDMGEDPIFGVSRITLHSELLGMSKASLDFRNKLYSNGLQLGGTVEYPVEAGITNEQLTTLRRSFETIYQGVVKRMRVAFLNNGGSFKPLKAGMSFADVQHIQSEKFTQEAILSLYLCPPGKIGLGEGSKYNNLEAMLTDFDKNVLTPLCVSWEQEHNRKIFRESEQDTHYIKCNIDALSRASIQDQITYLAKAINAGIYTPNEVRAMKDLNGYEGGDKALIPVNNVIPADRVNEWIDAYLSKKVSTANNE